MCAHFCYKMVHFGIFVWCIVGFVIWVYYIIHVVYCIIMFENLYKATLAWTNLTKPTKYPSHVPKCTIWNRNIYIAVLYIVGCETGAWWDLWISTIAFSCLQLVSHGRLHDFPGSQCGSCSRVSLPGSCHRLAAGLGSAPSLLSNDRL